MKKLSWFESNELAILKRAWKDYDGDLKAAASALGINRPRMLRKLRKYNLYKPLRRA